MADPRLPDASRMYLSHEVASGGSSQKLTMFSASNVNPNLSNVTFVNVGNALGELCRYDPDYIQRTDIYYFAPDEFEEG